MIKIKHSHGFFSCCSVKLHHIVEFININKILPNNSENVIQYLNGTWYK